MGLNELKMIDRVSKMPQDDATRRRHKLLRAVDKQLAKVEQGSSKLTFRNRWIFQQADGSYQLALMYGSKSLELAKGRHAIACSSIDQLTSALNILRQTVADGKLDKEIEAAAEAIKSGFKKQKK